MQQIALNNIREVPISFIQGPPGTGKTFTGAAIGLYFSIWEKGAVLITAPSNFAADGAAKIITELASTYGVSTKILRIFSHSRQDYLTWPDTAENLPTSFDVLHKEVKKSTNWLEGLSSISDSKFTIYSLFFFLPHS